MYIDYDLRLSKNQAITGSDTSTYYVDSVQSGWGVNDEVYARFMVQTAFAGSASASVTFSIQISQDTAFTTATNVLSVIKLASGLTLKSIPLVAKLPVAMMLSHAGGDSLYSPNTLPYRYVRAYYTVAAPVLTGGNITCDLVKDAPVTMDRSM